MARKTRVNRGLTTPELLEQVNPVNKQLQKDFKKYLRSLRRSPGTINGYMHDLDIFFVFLLKECGNKSIIDCNIRDFVNFQSYMLDENQNSPARARRIKATVGSFSNAIELLYADEYPNFRNLIRKVESPVNVPVRPKTVLTQEQICMLLDRLVSMGQCEKACCFALAAYSGRRKSELFRFKVSDFDEDRIVFGALYKSEPIITKGRSGGKKIACYTLVKQFKPYFDLWMRQRAENGIESEWLFPDPDDPTQPRPAGIMDSWSRTATRMMGLDIYPHAFRHAFVSYLAGMGLPNSVIVSIMQWEKSSGDAMIAIYNDADGENDLAKYFQNGEIVAGNSTSVTDL